MQRATWTSNWHTLIDHQWRGLDPCFDSGRFVIWLIVFAIKWVQVPWLDVLMLTWKTLGSLQGEFLLQNKRYWDQLGNWISSHHEILFTLLSLYQGDLMVIGDSLNKGPVMQSIDIFFVVGLNKLLNKQSSCFWFKMPLHSCDILCFAYCEHCCGMRHVAFYCITFHCLFLLHHKQP